MTAPTPEHSHPLPPQLDDADLLGDWAWFCGVTKLKPNTAYVLVGRGGVPGVVKLAPRITRFVKARVLAWFDDLEKEGVHRFPPRKLNRRGRL